MSSPPFGPSSPADGEEETEEQKRDREQCLDLMHGASLPLDSVCYAFAYGSGAIQQQGERRSEKMVDLILVCNDTQRFHRNNMLVNPAHYSALFRYLNRSLVNRFQRGHFPFPEGARVFYNTMVPSRGRLIKYGIVHAHDLLADLLGWYWLYVAGRLHKPVLDVFYNANLESMDNENEVIANSCRPVCTQDEKKWRLSEAIAQNRWMATQAALLMSSPNLAMEELLQLIASLSYRGDVRMGWAEDRLKIEKLVAGSHHRLRQIYLPMLKRDPWVHLSGDRIEQDCSDAALFERLQILPSPVLRRLRQQANCQQNLWQRLSTSFAQPADDNSIAIGEAQDELSQFLMANRRDLPQRLDSTLQAIVRRSSWQQSMRNALTAGIGRSFSYILPKLRKGLRL